ncbi:MAG: HD domain-containing protein [Planctomycetota bacterium]
MMFSEDYSRVNQQSIIDAAVRHIQDVLEGDSSGHDWWHIYRVWRMAVRLGTAEGADLFVVQLAALLHDIADWKFHNGDLTAGPRAARLWLESQQVVAATIDHVCEIIGHLSYKGAGVATDMPTLEGRVVQDADRLDAIGAIGIARAFAYGGHDGRALYDPEDPPEMHTSAQAYRNSRGATINHFHEKLLLLKERMQTLTGKQLAAQRHTYMEGYLAEFHAEWEGER